MAIAVAVAASPSAGESLKEQADRLCHAYIDTPEAFTEVETRSCTAQEAARLSTAPLYTEPNYCFTHGKNGRSEPEVFASVFSGGSCYSTSIVSLNGAGRPLRNASVNGYTFGMKDKALEYQGQLLLSGGEDLRLVTADEEIILCEFVRRFEGWRQSEPSGNELCQRLDRNEFSDGATPIGEGEWEAWPKYPEARPESRVRADLDGDGSEEEILGYDYASGAGCGCGAHPLTVLYNNALITWRDPGAPYGPVPPAIQVLGPALHDLTKVCGRNRAGIKWSVVRIDGKDFVLADFQPDRWQRWPDEGADFYVSTEIPSRELYDFRGDRFVKICEQRPISTKHVAHELLTKEEYYRLDYVPVTGE